MRTSAKKTLRIVQVALLTALIVVLQWFGSILTGFTGLPMSLVLIPIVIGAFILGPKEGAFLGIMFGIMTIVMGFTGLDPFTAILFNNFGVGKCIATVAICLIKAGLAGFGSGAIYKLLNQAFKGKKVVLSTVIASISAPIINTGIFVLGMLLFFFNDMSAIQGALGITQQASSLYFIFIGLAGINFIVEFVINLTISPAIVRIVEVVGKKLNK